MTGNKLGRTIGYPTANLQVEDREKLLPAYGVYAVTVRIEEREEPLHGMMNIGVRPTVQGKKETIEVHLFDFHEDIYGKRLQVSLHYRLRGEQKFEGLEALKEQLKKDQELSQMLLSGLR